MPQKQASAIFSGVPAVTLGFGFGVPQPDAEHSELRNFFYCRDIIYRKPQLKSIAFLRLSRNYLGAVENCSKRRLCI
jgi:hypothetical protein